MTKCTKQRYPTKNAASEALRSAMERAPKWRFGGPPVNVYKCPYCEGVAWHWGHMPGMKK